MINEARRGKAQPKPKPVGLSLSKEDQDILRGIRRLYNRGDVSVEEIVKFIASRSMPFQKHGVVEVYKSSPGDFVASYKKARQPSREVDGINISYEKLKQPKGHRQLAIKFSPDWNGGDIIITGKNHQGKNFKKTIAAAPGKTIVLERPVSKIKSIRNTGNEYPVELWDPKAQRNIVSTQREPSKGQVWVYYRVPETAPPGYAEKPEYDVHQGWFKAVFMPDPNTPGARIEELMSNDRMDAAKERLQNAIDSGDEKTADMAKQEIDRLSKVMSGLAQAGLREGDIIVGVNDQEVSSPDELSNAIKGMKPNSLVTLKVMRSPKPYLAPSAEDMFTVTARLDHKPQTISGPVFTKGETAIELPVGAGRFEPETINQYASIIERDRRNFLHVHELGIRALKWYDEALEDSEDNPNIDVQKVKAEAEENLSEATQVKSRFILKLIYIMRKLKNRAQEDWRIFDTMYKSLNEEDRAEYDKEFGRGKYSYSIMRRRFQITQVHLEDMIDFYQQARIRDLQPHGMKILDIARYEMAKQNLSSAPGEGVYKQQDGAEQKCPECGYVGDFEAAKLPGRGTENVEPIQHDVLHARIKDIHDDRIMLNVGEVHDVKEGMKFVIPNKDIEIIVDEVDERNSSGVVTIGRPEAIEVGDKVDATRPGEFMGGRKCPECGKVFRPEQIYKGTRVYDDEIVKQFEDELNYIPIEAKIIDIIESSMPYDTGDLDEEGNPIIGVKKVRFIKIDAGIKNHVNVGLDLDITDQNGVILGQAEVTKVGDTSALCKLISGKIGDIDRGDTVSVTRPISVSGWGDLWLPRWRSNATYSAFEPHRGGPGVDKYNLDALPTSEDYTNPYYIQPYSTRDIPKGKSKVGPASSAVATPKPGDVYAFKPKVDAPFIIVLNYLINIKAIEYGILSMARFNRKQDYFAYRLSGKGATPEPPVGPTADTERGPIVPGPTMPKGTPPSTESVERNCMVCESNPCRCCPDCKSFPCVCEDIEDERIKMISEFFGE